MCETVKLTFPGGFLGMKRNGFFFCEEVFFQEKCLKHGQNSNGGT